MQQHEFFSGLDVLSHLEMHELEVHGVIDTGDTGAWVDFTRDRIRWSTHAAPSRAERLWNLISGDIHIHAIAEESADELHTILQLAEEFGWDAKTGLWSWLRGRLEAADSRDACIEIEVV